MINELPDFVNRIIKEAYASSGKGDYQLYTYYKNMLNEVELTSDQYQEAIKRLSAALRV